MLIFSERKGSRNKEIVSFFFTKTPLSLQRGGSYAADSERDNGLVSEMDAA